MNDSAAPPLNAYRISALSTLGIDVAALGCVMLDVALPPFETAIPDEWAYRSAHPKLSHVSGVQREAHLTLLYGLLANAHTWRAHVDEVLEGWIPPESMPLTRLEVFGSPMPDEEPYGCIVALPDPETSGLLAAHRRLSMLPHIDTHAVYKPHVTLAYVHSSYTDQAMDLLAAQFPVRAYPTGLNYGHLEGR